MKRILRTILLITLLALSFTAWSQEQVTLENGSFEGETIKSWSVTGGEASLSTDISQSGSQSLKIGSGIRPHG